MTPRDDFWDSFCVYCQHRYASPAKLRTHIRAKHPDTYAAYALLPEHQKEQK